MTDQPLTDHPEPFRWYDATTDRFVVAADDYDRLREVLLRMVKARDWLIDSEWKAAEGELGRAIYNLNRIIEGDKP